MSALVIDDIEIARALHVVFVAHWIGGVAFVTLVALPLARARRCEERLDAVRGDRKRFAAQVRSHSACRRGRVLDDLAARLWPLFAEPAVWWMDAMVLLWALFMLIVFVVEPLAHSASPRWPPGSRRAPRPSVARPPRPARGGRSSQSSAPSPARTGGYSGDDSDRKNQTVAQSVATARGGPSGDRGLRAKSTCDHRVAMRLTKSRPDRRGVGTPPERRAKKRGGAK